MSRPDRSIVLDRTTPQEDWDEYAYDHLGRFGHYPIKDVTGQKLCIHPLHDAIKQVINAPGVDLKVEFNVHEVVADDEQFVVDAERAYQKRVDEQRDRIREHEERKAFEQRRQSSHDGSTKRYY